jgi:hypothetical protein
MRSLSPFDEVIRKYCAGLGHTFRYTGDIDQLTETMISMISESRQVQAALGQIIESPAGSLFHIQAMEEAVEIAIGSYFRYLEQKGRCSDADRLAHELAVLVADSAVNRASPGGKA